MRFIEKIIDAFSLLCQIKVSHLRIAGSIEDPVYYEKLLAQIDELGISSAVSFVAPVPVPAEDPARDQIDLVWMISLSGHIGYAGIESMAAGLPTLLLEVDHYASATPSDPELVDAISNTAQHLVERSLAVYADLDNFRNQQSHLVRQRFMTTKQAIDELTAFYLAPQ
jgi:glycosyltransferase involved in cell wall biosynthesis